MALVGLIRVRLLAKLLNVDHRTVEKYLNAMGLESIRAPVVGMPGRTGTGHTSPRYVSMDNATKLVARMLPGKMERVTRKRITQRMEEAEAELRKSTKNIHNDIGAELPTLE
jgi:hypothetical protein